jgi:2-phosphosulfolactate phosphatase
VIYYQKEFDIRLEWGRKGVEELAPISDVIIIVDILSFSTCVDIATKNGAIIYPYSWKDDTAIEYAKKQNAELADFKRNYTEGLSLSPTSLLNIKPNTRLVLPSPNGSALSLSTGKTKTICGSLRNAIAVANYAKKIGEKISIIPAGEQWDNNTLRVAFEDLIGAGAIISYLTGAFSPESKTGLSLFQKYEQTLTEEIKTCASGKELIERGFEKDVLLACELNTSNNVPVLIDNFYIGQKVYEK